MSEQQGRAQSLAVALKDNMFAICQGREATRPTTPSDPSAVLLSAPTSAHTMQEMLCASMGGGAG